MKYCFRFVSAVFVVTSALFTQCVYAEAGSAEDSGGQLYGGLKVGQFLIDVDFLDIDDADVVGFMAGYDFGERFSLQLEYMTGDTDAGNVDFDIDTFGGYGVFRSAGNAYIMGKIGLVKEDLTASNGLTSISEDDSGTSLGIGAGFRAGEHLAAELEYTLIEEDMDFLGATFYARF